MDRLRRPIVIDPFYDGDIVDETQQQAPVTRQPDGSYGDVDATTRSQMRGGTAKLRGTIIPKATMGGIPVGTRPHATADVEITIDPHINGQSSKVRLGDLNAHNIQQAIAAASEFTPEPTNIQTFRLRGSAIMHTLANQVQHTGIEQAAVQVQQQPTQQNHVVPTRVMNPVQPVAQPQRRAQPGAALMQKQAAVPQQAVRRVVSPLAAFDQQFAPQQRETRQFDLGGELQPHVVNSQQPASAVYPPEIQVVFEMEHFGTLPTAYHDVIIENGFLVLVYDTRFNGSKYFPQVPTGTAPRTAMNIVGTREIYVVQTTGLQFVHDEREFCILMIEHTAEMPD